MALDACQYSPVLNVSWSRIRRQQTWPFNVFCHSACGDDRRKLDKLETTEDVAQVRRYLLDQVWKL